MKFGVPREREPGETRVAFVPDTVKLLAKKGHAVIVEAGAGASAFVRDADYEAAGATIARSTAELYGSVDCVLRVKPPAPAEIEQLREGSALVSFLWAARNPGLVDALGRRKIRAFAMDAIPRITRAQSMDALSSMATIAGYKAVLLAANHLARFFPMLTTAAGTIRPAQGLIIGAGVAGLQAIATARRLGAVVEAFDLRPAVKEQVLSLGAKFVDLPGLAGGQDKYGYAKEATDEQKEAIARLIRERVKAADFIITTALVPGKPAPRLITRQMLAEMKGGSVIVDLAGEAGGNCEASRPDQVVVENGVTVLAPLNLPATMPADASRMYARNVLAFLLEITNEKGFTDDMANEVFRETLVTEKKS